MAYGVYDLNCIVGCARVCMPQSVEGPLVMSSRKPHPEPRTLTKKPRPRMKKRERLRGTDPIRPCAQTVSTSTPEST